MTAATLNVTGAHGAEVEDASTSATAVAGTEAERLQPSATASPADIPVTQREHHNVSSSDNSSTEIPSPAPTASSTLEENPPDREVTEPFSTTEEMDDASSATPTTPLNSVLGEVLPFLAVQKVLPQGCTTRELTVLNVLLLL